MMNKNLYRNLMIMILLGSMLGGFWWWRSEIVTWWWRQTYTLPSVVLYLSADPNLAFSMGNFYFESTPEWGRYDIEKAEYYYTKARELSPEHPRANYQLARIAFITGRFDLALDRINAHMRTYGDAMPNAYYLRGLVHGFKGGTDSAIADFTTYLDFGVADWYPYNNLAWLYFQKGQYDEMFRVTDEALSYFPENAWLLQARGLAHLNIGNIQAAELDLNRAQTIARDLTPEDWAAVYPGNDPQIAKRGLREFLDQLALNVALVQSAHEGNE